MLLPTAAISEALAIKQTSMLAWKFTRDPVFESLRLRGDNLFLLLCLPSSLQFPSVSVSTRNHLLLVIARYDNAQFQIIDFFLGIENFNLESRKYEKELLKVTWLFTLIYFPSKNAIFVKGNI